MNAFIRWFHELGLADVALVGGKNASRRLRDARRGRPGRRRRAQQRHR